MRYTLSFWRMLLLMGLPAASLGAGSSGNSGSEFVPQRAFVTGHKTVFYAELSPADIQLCRLEAINSSVLDLESRCAEVCPSPGLVNFHDQCVTGHAFHSAHSVFHEAQSLLSGRQYTIFSLSFFVIIGAICRIAFPKWLPYTVGLLVLSFMVAVIGEYTHLSNDCPMYALRLSGHDGTVQRSEWDGFICAGCHPESFCVKKKRTCGDGSANPSGCRWSFDDLNKPRYLHSMETVQEWDPHAADVLTADQLWRPECNLYNDLLLPLAETDPHVMLVVFLPLLLFESAFFGIDFGIFRTQIAQILLMAFPAMIMSSLVTAVLLWFVMLGFYPDWPFLPCWLAGVITSATDPVAVVALLKELGAAKTLGTLIEGESLMNDGSAVVLFVVVRNAIGYASTVLAPEWMPSMIGLEIMRIVAQMLFLGIVFGLAVGFVTRHVLRLVYNDRMVEGSLLIAVSYLTFWAAELVMGSSAVLAVVVFGLYMNNHKSVLSPECLHFLHEFFELTCHMLNTIIFVIAGLQLGNQIMSTASAHVEGESMWHIWVALIMIYPIVIVSRGVAIATFYPLLKRLGTQCTWQEAIVMWWGGLRGAVGLALALAVHHTAYDAKMWSSARNDAWHVLLCRDQPTMILMVTCSVVTTTVIINGITMAPLMRKLGLTDLTEDRVLMLQSAWAEIDEKMEHFIKETENNHIKHFRKVNWEAVKAHQVRPQEWLAAAPVVRNHRAAWLHVLNMEAEAYHGQYEAGTLGSEAFYILGNHISVLRAKAINGKLEGKQLSDLYDEHHADLIKKLSSSIRGKRRDPQMAVLHYEVGLSYLWGFKRVQAIMHELELKDPYPQIVAEHEDNKESTANLLQDLDRIYPTSINQFKTLHVAGRALRKQRNVVSHLVHQGALVDLDAVQIYDKINDKLRQLYRGREPLKEAAKDITTSLQRMGTLRALRTSSSKAIAPEAPAEVPAEGRSAAAGKRRFSLFSQQRPTEQPTPEEATHHLNNVAHGVTGAVKIRREGEKATGNSEGPSLHTAPLPPITSGKELEAPAFSAPSAEA